MKNKRSRLDAVAANLWSGSTTLSYLTGRVLHLLATSFEFIVCN